MKAGAGAGADNGCGGWERASVGRFRPRTSFVLKLYLLHRLSVFALGYTLQIVDLQLFY
jgi:hypothetical protein